MNNGQQMVPAGPPVGQNALALPAEFDSQPSGLSVRYELLMKLAAKSPPRNADALIKEAKAIGGRLGEDGFYSWEVQNRHTGKTDIIEGVSIDLVEALRGPWGFLAVEARISQMAGDAICLDAEVFDAKDGNLTARPALFTISKPPGKFAENAEQAQRWRAMQFQSAVSKAVRGALEHALPAWYVNPALRAAKEAYEAKMPTGEALEGALAKSIAGFRKDHGVTVDELAEYLGVQRQSWDGKCGTRLGALWRALDEKYTTIEEVFGPIREAARQRKAPAAGPAEPSTPPALPPPSPSASKVLGLDDSGQSSLGIDTAPAKPERKPRQQREQAAEPPALSEEIVQSYRAALQEPESMAGIEEVWNQIRTKPMPTQQLSDLSRLYMNRCAEFRGQK